MNERWKPVVGYEGWYDVSDQGRVRRIKAYKTTYVGRILRPSKDTRGYNGVDLCKKNIVRRFLVHRLVLMAFRGLPLPGQEGNHKNGNKADNRLKKLGWVTRSENQLHKYRVLGALTLKGEQNGLAKLKDKNIPLIRRLLARGNLPQRAIGGMFGVSRGTIQKIKYGKTWTHI